MAGNFTEGLHSNVLIGFAPIQMFLVQLRRDSDQWSVLYPTFSQEKGE